MTEATRKLLAQAELLSKEEQAELAQAMVTRLTESGELSAEWTQEIKKRLADLQRGSATTVSWDAAREFLYRSRQ